MSYDRSKAKGRRDNKPFVKMYRDVLDSPEYAALPGWSVKLLMDLYAQFKGSNNGDLCAAFTVMQKRGWHSKGTLHASIKDLRKKGWIELSRQGGRNKASLYAITYLPVDECKGKIDIPETTVPTHAWKRPKLVSVPAMCTNVPAMRTSGTMQ